MFRRKTDQVYATLQQVQRRITQQNAGDEPDGVAPPPQATGTAPSAPAAEVPRAMSVQSMALAASAAAPTALPGPAPTATPTLGASTRRHLLTLSGELATILFLLWLVTLVVAFFVGQHVGKRSQPPDEAPAGYAAGAAGGRPVAAAPAPATSPAESPSTPAKAGTYVLVLQSIARVSPDDEQRFANDARRLNDYAAKNPQSGFKPWFGVRKPTSGGLQLVFGLVGERFGVDREPFAAFAEQLDRAGYKGARWVAVDAR